MYKIVILDNIGKEVHSQYFQTKPRQGIIDSLRMRFAKSLGCIPMARLSFLEKNYAGAIIEKNVA